MLGKICVQNQLSKDISEKFFLLIQGADYEPKNKYKSYLARKMLLNAVNEIQLSELADSKVYRVSGIFPKSKYFMI